jgi:hypothetical protein
MKLVGLALVLVAATATAHAQAPGDWAQEGPVAPPGMAAPVAVAVPAPEVAVMANRWAVGMSVGSLSIAPKDQPDNKTDFGVGELSLRFRATYHLELEVALGGGREQLKDGTQGSRETNTGLLGLRYRFCADRHWNWWLGGGIGSISVTQTGATDQEKHDAERPMGALSIGIEHRWQQFALHAELRGFGVGQPQNQAPQVKAVPVSMPGNTTTQPPPPTMTSPTDQQQSGAMFTIGASYYF